MICCRVDGLGSSLHASDPFRIFIFDKYSGHFEFNRNKPSPRVHLDPLTTACLSLHTSLVSEVILTILNKFNLNSNYDLTDLLPQELFPYYDITNLVTPVHRLKNAVKTFQVNWWVLFVKHTLYINMMISWSASNKSNSKATHTWWILPTIAHWVRWVDYHTRWTL